MGLQKVNMFLKNPEINRIKNGYYKTLTLYKKCVILQTKFVFRTL